MLEFSEDIPFLWRLSAESGDGFSLVSMVIPFQAGSENHEHTIPTNVVSFNGDHEKLSEEETLEWNEDDVNLFLKLLAERDVLAHRAFGLHALNRPCQKLAGAISAQVVHRRDFFWHRPPS
jgi:hypothetical protein